MFGAALHDIVPNHKGSTHFALDLKCEILHAKFYLNLDGLPVLVNVSIVDQSNTSFISNSVIWWSLHYCYYIATMVLRGTLYSVHTS